MDIRKILSEATSTLGVSGQEAGVAAYFAEQFRLLVDEVRVDAMYNVIAHKKGSGNGPKIMLCAHLDEIALMVMRIEDDGSVRFGSVGGVDPRILPGSRVWVHGTKGKLFGTIGALPPHLMSEEDRNNNYKMDKLHVDLGMCAGKVREQVRVGDLITFNTPFTELAGNQVAAKSLDDRACVAIMLRAAERLQRMACDAEVYFVCSAQEEVGGRGAMTAAFGVDPDLAVVLDVDFALTPGCGPDVAAPLDAMVVTHGPFVQPKLNKRLIDCAHAHHVKLSENVAGRSTGTDADEIGVNRGGVPTVLLSLPEKYMHTSVETISLDTLEEGARLLSHFVSELDAGWEDDLWI
ncbi:MAG: M20/M25/M40 family metallo-hydrolase [Clostridia bacterium]|nr:M20/M25/M40 family metallo-hydrolase [Clostridia bacterium]